MSQLKDFDKDETDPLRRSIRSLDDLIQLFVDFEKEKSAFKVGTEHERFIIQRQKELPMPYSGDHGIERLLHILMQPGQSAVTEQGCLVGISCQGYSISLEPGGQLELSGAAVGTIHETWQELLDYEERVQGALSQLGGKSLLLGFHPTATRQQIEWVPKARYEIMRGYMPTRGTRGLDMMLRTCTVQANLDYQNESDMVASFQTALALSPIVAGLFASSSSYEGKPSPFFSERMQVWCNTDSSRSGFPQVVFEPRFGYEKWVNFVLDVPMYFIRRDGNYINLAGASFREFMKNGFRGYTATVRDFFDHLTTIFTQVRLKPQLEMRSADCGPLELVCALPALWKGLLYDERARERAAALMSEPAAGELDSLYDAISRVGLEAKWRGVKASKIAEDLLDIAKAGLERQGLGEEQYLRFGAFEAPFA